MEQVVKDLSAGSGVFKLARYIGHRYPRIKRMLLPLWRPFKNGCWFIRNILTRNRPVEVKIDRDAAMLLYPEGQIARFMWGTEFELEERKYIASYLGPGMRVVNVGANVGLYTIMASKLVGNSGNVQAFEPSSITFNRLMRNIHLNDCSNVQAYQVAISDECGKLVLRADPRNAELDGHRFVEKIGLFENRLLATDEVVECSTLDKYLISANGGSILPIDVMIVDVEGSELSVLRGGLKTIAASPNLVLMLECARDQRLVEELLIDAGFKFFRLGIEESSFSRAILWMRL